MLLVASLFCVFVSCSKDETEDFFDPSVIYGSWGDTQYDSSGNPSSDMTWTFYSNQKATQRLTLYLMGSVFMDRTLNYTYQYTNKNTISLRTEKGEIIHYNVFIDGKYMKLGNEESGYFELIKK